MTENRILYWTFLLSLLLHAAVLLVTWNWQLFVDPEVAEREEPQSVELFLIDDEELQDFDPPQSYTSTPARHEVEEPPSQPDFLSVRKSQAADMLEGGEENSSPGTVEKSPFSQVKIRQHEEAMVSGEVVVAKENEETESEAEEEGVTADELEGSLSEGKPDSDNPEKNIEPVPDIASLFNSQIVSILENQSGGSSGDQGFDYDQHATSTSEGNVVQFGDFSLNTIDWDYAPWMEKFKRDFMPNWQPPYAYALGVIEGVTKLKLVIEHDGRIGELKRISGEGHESLHNASEAALWATAPFARLPNDFPEESLVIILSLHYPDWKQESAKNMQQNR
ncbi:MAG: TonB C-terminal domain-containing protein [bacterium]|nr:TonB C-terminal domain-containing protein [bacterium]MCP4800035.1 TonB C-terminal domain-containing protein [bacterium]